jgi:hypothetical protein
MLSMENCASPDGSMVGYYPNQTCASLGLNKYHWQPEPFHHLWMWLQTPAGQIITMIARCAQDDTSSREVNPPETAGSFFWLTFSQKVESERARRQYTHGNDDPKCQRRICTGRQRDVHAEYARYHGWNGECQRNDGK